MSICMIRVRIEGYIAIDCSLAHLTGVNKSVVLRIGILLLGVAIAVWSVVLIGHG